MPMSAAVTTDSLRYYLTTDLVGTRPTAWTLSLHTGNPGTDGTANEVAYTGYARETVAFDVDVTDPDLPEATNSADVVFDVNTAAMVITHLVVWGDGEPLVVAPLVSPKTVPADTPATVAAGELIIGGRN